MLTSSVLFVAGMTFVRFGPHFAFLLIGQFTIGFSTQYLACVVPAYTSEVSQPKLRKFTGTFFTSFFGFGMFLTFLLTAIFQPKTSMVIILVMAGINFTLLMFCPKSPTWLMNKGRKEEAFEVLKRIRGCEVVATEELKRLEENMKEQASAVKQKHEERMVQRLVQNLRQPSFLKPLILLAVLFLFGLQLSGATTMPIYFITVLNETGVVKVFDPYWAASTLNLWRVFVSIVTIIVASRIKRRPLLMFAGCVCTLGWLITGLSTYFYQTGQFKDLEHILPWITYFAWGTVITGYASGFVMVLYMLL